MVLYIDNEFYVIQILESFYVEIIIFPVIFDGQTPMWSNLIIYCLFPDCICLGIKAVLSVRFYPVSRYGWADPDALLGWKFRCLPQAVLTNKLNVVLGTFFYTGFENPCSNCLTAL